MMMLFWLKKVVHAPTNDMITGGEINSTYRTIIGTKDNTCSRFMGSHKLMLAM